MKKTIAILMALAMMIAAVAAVAEDAAAAQTTQTQQTDNLTAKRGHGPQGGPQGQQPGNGRQMPPMPGDGQQVPQMPGSTDAQAPADGQQAPEAGQLPENGQESGGDEAQSADSSAQPGNTQPGNGNCQMPGKNGKNGRNGKNGQQGNGFQMHGMLNADAMAARGVISQDTAAKVNAWMAQQMPASMLQQMLDAGVITQAEYEAMSADLSAQQASADAVSGATGAGQNN